MNISPPPPRQTCVKIQGQQVEAVDSFNYFENVLKNNPSVEKATRSRMGKTSGIFCKMVKI